MFLLSHKLGKRKGRGVQIVKILGILKQHEKKGNFERLLSHKNKKEIETLECTSLYIIFA